jgi:hypothetical protein
LRPSKAGEYFEAAGLQWLPLVEETARLLVRLAHRIQTLGENGSGDFSEMTKWINSHRVSALHQLWAFLVESIH